MIWPDQSNLIQHRMNSLNLALAHFRRHLEGDDKIRALRRVDTKVSPRLMQVLDGRNPTLLLSSSGRLLLRFAARTLVDVLLNEPPRNTRRISRHPCRKP